MSHLALEHSGEAAALPSFLLDLDGWNLSLNAKVFKRVLTMAFNSFGVCRWKRRSKEGFKKIFLILSVLIKSEMVIRDCCKGKTAEGTQYFVNSNFGLMQRRIW